MGCTCENVAFGAYEACELVDLPWGGQAGIDRCVLPDVRDLWAGGIRTIESCCGHNRTAGYVAVRYEDMAAMLARGWKRDPRTEALNIFLWPKDESPIVVGKLWACERILRSGRDVHEIMAALDKIFDAPGWLYAEALRRFLSPSPMGAGG